MSEIQHSPCAISGGTCVFHDDNDRRLTIVYDWHLGAKERTKVLEKKLDRLSALIGTGVLGIIIDIVLRLSQVA